MVDVNTLINDEKYDFLRTDKHLKQIMFLTLGGSHAYGTNVVGSDIDIRGVALNSQSDLIGLTNFEQVIDIETDTTVYSFNKFINLLINCNPNTIELLGNKDYYMLSKEGKLLLDNKGLFLSQKAISSFGGYATQQLKRLENFLTRDAYSQELKEAHIKSSCESCLKAFSNKYENFDTNSIKLFLESSSKDNFDVEIFADFNLNKFPLRDIKTLLNDMNSIIKNYNNLNNRNRKKDDLHLNKHAMHLVRLHLMCLDIVEKGEINTYRENDLKLLMDIRNGCYQKEDRTYKKEFFDIVNDFENKVKSAVKHTSLPKNPDMKKIEELVMTINKGVIFSE